jgi:hypothetical protein
MEELKKEFAELNAELASPNCTEPEKKLNRVREILKQRCKDQNFTIDDIIDSMNLEKLRELDGTLNRIQGQQNRDEINELARNAQTDNNRYSEDNPYSNNI